MNYNDLRNELKNYYRNEALTKAKDFAEKCFSVLDKRVADGMTPTDQKLLQYDVIANELEPVVFKNTPFYFETGALTAMSDGSYWAKGGNFVQAGGWTFCRNQHLFKEQDEALWEKRTRQGNELLYLICGPYNDTTQHFNFNNRPIFESGLSGIYDSARAEMQNAETEKEREFLKSVCEAMLQIKKTAEKFAKRAEELLLKEENEKHRKNLRLIAETARRVPWEKPETLYEALNTLAFMRKIIGTFEGVGPNTFGRVDMDLYPFYRSDIEKGILTKEEAYSLISQFLICFDMHYDHDIKMVGYADHELENNYVLGGCDSEGKPFYNELTEMFLSAVREEKIIFPKVKCRYSKESPKEYLDEIDKSVINGTSTVLYTNDDAMIPALVRQGVPLEEARDYLVTGCWSITLNGVEKYDHGTYLNILKSFEFALHNRKDKMDYVGINFDSFDNAESFEELYATVVENCRRLFEERISITNKGGLIWDKVAPLPIFSSTLKDCIEQRKDFTSGGGRYHNEYLYCVGFPEIVDSLLAIKTLVFDEKKYTLAEMLNAVRNNWDGYENMRVEATLCAGWGDGSEDSCKLAKQFNDDLYAIASRLRGRYGGRVGIGHLTYTEIRFWGEKTLATPNGRKNGEYISQGLTPSRLKKIPSVTSVINSLAALDKTEMSGGNVVNIILSSTDMTLDICEAFLRTVTYSSTICLQLNCVTREQLLDAQKHPEKYPDIIVRVCGFSAKFTSLSKEWQEEVISRNFFK